MSRGIKTITFLHEIQIPSPIRIQRMQLINQNKTILLLEQPDAPEGTKFLKEWMVHE